MAATYSFAADELGWQRRGSKKSRRGVLTLAGTYTNPGGDAVTLAQLNCGFASLDRVVFLDAATSIGQVPAYDKATGKVFLRESGAAAAVLPEVGNTETVAGTINVEVIGN